MFTEPPILKRDIWISHPHHFVVFTLYITKKLNYTFHIILLGIPERFIRIRVSLVPWERIIYLVCTWDFLHRR